MATSFFSSGLTKLESLNLDSCHVGDEGLGNLSGNLFLLFVNLHRFITYLTYFDHSVRKGLMSSPCLESFVYPLQLNNMMIFSRTLFL